MVDGSSDLHSVLWQQLRKALLDTYGPQPEASAVSDFLESVKVCLCLSGTVSDGRTSRALPAHLLNWCCKGAFAAVLCEAGSLESPLVLGKPSAYNGTAYSNQAVN